jgi:hypothetical protein
MPPVEGGGRYKVVPNKIGGSAHAPLPPWDTRQAMEQLARWLQSGTGDPVLDAAVAHAWLTHVHPFADGNGRMARLLANLALIQAHFPLFVSAIRRAVRLMEKPNYVQSKIRGELLVTIVQRRQAWKGIAEGLYLSLRNRAREVGWSAHLQGYPGIDEFELLEAAESKGSCWFVKLRDPRGLDRWVLWFSYETDELRDLTGRHGRRFPSVFFARRSRTRESGHPFRPLFSSWRGA